MMTHLTCLCGRGYNKYLTGMARAALALLALRWSLLINPAQATYRLKLQEWSVLLRVGMKPLTVQGSCKWSRVLITCTVNLSHLSRGSLS